MTWPVTPVATGDLVVAAQLNSLPIALAEASGAAASYTFSSIPAAWTHLLLVSSFQTGAGATHDDVRMTFNGVTAAQYYHQRQRATGATSTPAEALGVAFIIIGSVSGQSTGGFSSNSCWIPNYSAVQIHNIHATGFSALGILTGNMRIETYGGIWNSATAITSITLTPSAGSFVAGSTSTLYGLGAI